MLPCAGTVMRKLTPGRMKMWWLPVTRASVQPFDARKLLIRFPLIFFISDGQVHNQVAALDLDLVQVDAQTAFDGIIEVLD